MAVTSLAFTKVGRQWLVDKMDDTSALKMERLGVGTGSTAASADDTALGAEVESRGLCTLTQVTANGVAGSRMQAVGQVAITADRALREFALFDAASAGNMAVRGVHDVINLSNGHAIEWTIQLGFV